MFRQRLRSKGGCQRCKGHRKKCDEQKPICGTCFQWNLTCTWPTQPLSQTETPTSRDDKSENLSESGASDVSETTLSDTSYASTQSQTVTRSDAHSAFDLWSEWVAQRAMYLDLTSSTFRHFMVEVKRTILLPECAPDFHDAWGIPFKTLFQTHNCLKFSVLANAASHVNNQEVVPRLREFALLCYSLAIDSLLSLLTSDTKVEYHDGFLFAIVFLYLHGYIGDTYDDAPRHLAAAVNVLRLRLSSGPDLLLRMLDVVTIESVFLQIFYHTTGCWSDPKPQHDIYDCDFWLHCEQLLGQTNFYPRCSTSFNSPVIGVPIALFRLAISTRHLDQTPVSERRSALCKISSELAKWETAVFNNVNLDNLGNNVQSDNVNTSVCADAASLYVLAISLRLSQLSDMWTSEQAETMPTLSTQDWRVRKALQILRRRYNDPTWAVAYVGNWPTYTIGYLVQCPEVMSCVRLDLQHRWKVQKFSVIARYAQDLENVWASKGCSLQTAMATIQHSIILENNTLAFAVPGTTPFTSV